MNRAAVVPLRMKSVGVPLNTNPVGRPVRGPSVPAMSTTTAVTLAPVLPLYSVDRLPPLSETHPGAVGPATIPQPLTRSGSVFKARPGTSDWRFVTTNAFWLFALAAVAGAALIARATSPAVSARVRLAIGHPPDACVAGSDRGQGDRRPGVLAGTAGEPSRFRSVEGVEGVEGA